MSGVWRTGWRRGFRIVVVAAVDAEPRPARFGTAEADAVFAG